MKRIGARILLDAGLRPLDGGDDRPRRGERSVREEELRVHGTEIARWPHVDVMSSEHEERARALGLIGHNDGEPPAPGLNLANEPKRGLPVASLRDQDQM